MNDTGHTWKELQEVETDGRLGMSWFRVYVLVEDEKAAAEEEASLLCNIILITVH